MGLVGVQQARARRGAGVGTRPTWGEGHGEKGRERRGEGRGVGCRAARVPGTAEWPWPGGRRTRVSQCTAPPSLAPPSVRQGPPVPQADLWSLSCPVLIRLKKKGDRCAVRSQFVQPICLPDPSSPFPAGHKCQIAGWGHQDESEWGWEHRGQGCGGPPRQASPNLRAPVRRREWLLQLPAGGAGPPGGRPQVQQPRGVWGRHQPPHAVRWLL